MKKNITSKIALGGICLALTLILLFAGSVVPGVELTLFALSSLFTAIIIIEYGTGGGLLLYAAAVILGIVLIPNKLAMIPYAFFFGYYGILKFYIEKLKNAVIQLTVKTLFFILLLCVGLLGFKELLLGSISLPDFPVAALIAGGTVLLILYDYIYTFLIDFYMRRIKRKGADNMKLS